MKWVSLFRGNVARVLAILALIAGVIGTSVPGFAAAGGPARPMAMHAAMGCGNGAGHAPMRRLPAADCCAANVCATNLALPLATSGIALPTLPEPRYALRALRQPAGIVTAPIPHPPKAAA